MVSERNHLPETIYSRVHILMPLKEAPLLALPELAKILRPRQRNFWRSGATEVLQMGILGATEAPQMCGLGASEAPHMGI